MPMRLVQVKKCFSPRRRRAERSAFNESRDSRKSRAETRSEDAEGHSPDAGVPVGRYEPSQSREPVEIQRHVQI